VEAELDALRACLARRRQTGRPALPAAAAARLATLAERARGLAAEAAAVPTAGFDAALAPLDTDGDTDDPTADAIDDL
jgi:formate-dependent phosphoribosylglycinamide formyltransferase (GAR transformylase)